MMQAGGLLASGASGNRVVCSRRRASLKIAIRGDWIPRIPAGMTAVIPRRHFNIHITATSA
ncbi:MAG: hypothetical protein ACR2P7_03770 [bacterium]